MSRIQSQLIQSWDILSTLTPADYLKFRDTLGQASGFQSHQYRMMEFLLGNKRAAMLAPHRHRPDLHAALKAALEAPSLYDATIRLLARRGFAIAPEVLARDLTTPHRSDPSVLAAWAEIYRNTHEHWDLYQLAEDLVDLEDWFQQWRFRHMTTVKRIIGFKTGDRRHGGRRVPAPRARYDLFPGTVGGPHRASVTGSPERGRLRSIQLDVDAEAYVFQSP